MKIRQLRERERERERERPTSFEVVAMAASAGGLQALSVVIGGLPQDYPIPILIVQHLARQRRSLMPEIISRRTTLKVQDASDGDILNPGTVYFATPDRHLLVNPGGRLFLSQSELVHFVRPSADLLFESVAAVYKDRAIAVVLTGSGNDGAMGVQAIKKMGGTVIAQDRETSESFGMPEAAIRTGDVDFILPLNEIPSVLITLVMKGGATSTESGKREMKKV